MLLWFCISVCCVMILRSFYLYWQGKTSKIHLCITALIFIGAGALLAWQASFDTLVKRPGPILYLPLVLLGVDALLQKRKHKVLKYRIVFFSLFSVLFLVELFCLTLPHLYLDRPLAVIEITGSTQKRQVEWKSLSSSLMQQELLFYEVRLLTLDQKELVHEYLCGDLVGIRAKIIRLHPALTFLGLSNLFLMDSLFSDYYSVDKKSQRPIVAYTIRQKSLGKALVHLIWEMLFFGKRASYLVRATTLEDQLFPLVDKNGQPSVGSYYLVMTTKGLSSIKKEAE